EDAFQATWLALAQRPTSVREPAALASWLHSTAYRIARKVRARADRRAVPQGAPEPVSDNDPGREAAWRELGLLVEEEVHALPQKYRVPILLCYWQGLTTEEAARQIGCPSGTVKTRLVKARQLLQAGLLRRGVSLPAG